MRASYNGSFIKDNDNIIGINLGSDYCAEHEWGISDIKRMLGMDEKLGYGLSRRKVTKQSQHLAWIEKNLVGFVLYEFFDQNDLKNWLPRETFSFSDKGNGDSFYAGWSKSGLYVLAKKDNKVAIAKIKELFDALNNNNACIWLGGGGIFQNAGLCIGIVDKMPKEIFDGWGKADKANQELKQSFDDTGIEKFLRDAGKDWFYLGPKLNANNEMIIWLNPRQQDKYESGYFTVEQLKLWAQEKGPVMKPASKNNKRARY